MIGRCHFATGVATHTPGTIQKAHTGKKLSQHRGSHGVGWARFVDGLCVRVFFLFLICDLRKEIKT